MAHIKGKTGSTRLTKNYSRTRKFQPSGVTKGSYFTKKTKSGFIVLGKSKRTGKTVVQAVAKRRK